MAYDTIEALPQDVQSTLPQPAQQIYMAAYNGASSDGMNEENAKQVAWNSVKNVFVQTDSGEWVYKDKTWDHESSTGTMPHS